MISIQCPHCHVGLKVDESKIPDNIQTFACPKCKQPIPVKLVISQRQKDEDSETILLSPNTLGKIGRLLVRENVYTPAQVINLREGVNIIGRKSASSDTPTSIETLDKQMSRMHIALEVKKNKKNQYIHSLSDNKSKNRTLYNNNYLESGETVVLKNKDEIQIGQTLLVFEE